MALSSPLVSVIIPVLNDYGRLRQCIDAIEKQDYQKESIEVVIVDNGSCFPFEQVTSEKLKIVNTFELKNGSYAARNKGLGLATGEIYAFTDSDCIPDHRWISRGVNELLSIERCGLVGGRIELFSEDDQNDNAFELYEKLFAFRQKEYVELGKFGVTANMFALKSVFNDVGMFNSELMSSGDKEWGQRVYKLGYQIAYSEDAYVRHPARNTFSDLKRKALRVAFGLYQLAGIRGEIGFLDISVCIKRILQVCVDVLRTVWLVNRVLRDSTVSNFKNRLHISFIAFYLRYLKIIESIRLELGLSPKIFSQ